MLAVLINFCSNEYPFLENCIAEAKKVSSQVIVSVCDHFFDGTPEDQSLLNGIYAEHPDIQFIQFAYAKENIYAFHARNYWHNLGRLLGFYFVDQTVDRVLFLDADEIVESQQMLAWLNAFPYQKYGALRLSCYWYFREAAHRAREWEDTPLLVDRKTWDGQLLMDPQERAGGYHAFAGEKMRQVVGMDGCPMLHHYSWVRTKEQMLRKVTSWGHHQDRNWEKLVHEEFSTRFKGKDFVHGYAFDTVEPYAEIDLTSSPIRTDKKPNNVRFLNTHEIHKIDLSLRFGIPICIPNVTQ